MKKKTKWENKVGKLTAPGCDNVTTEYKLSGRCLYQLTSVLGRDWVSQTEQEKRQVRRNLRDLYEKLSQVWAPEMPLRPPGPFSVGDDSSSAPPQNKEKYAAGGDNEEISNIIKEANEVLHRLNTLTVFIQSKHCTIRIARCWGRSEAPRRPWRMPKCSRCSNLPST